MRLRKNADVVRGSGPAVLGQQKQARQMQLTRSCTTWYNSSGRVLARDVHGADMAAFKAFVQGLTCLHWPMCCAVWVLCPGRDMVSRHIASYFVSRLLLLTLSRASVSDASCQHDNGFQWRPADTPGSASQPVFSVCLRITHCTMHSAWLTLPGIMRQC